MNQSLPSARVNKFGLVGVVIRHAVQRAQVDLDRLRNLGALRARPLPERPRDTHHVIPQPLVLWVHLSVNWMRNRFALTRRVVFATLWTLGQVFMRLLYRHTVNASWCHWIELDGASP